MTDFIKEKNEEGPAFELGITVHNFGQYAVYPWGYIADDFPPNADDLVCRKQYDRFVPFTLLSCIDPLWLS